MGTRGWVEFCIGIANSCQIQYAVAHTYPYLFGKRYYILQFVSCMPAYMIDSEAVHDNIVGVDAALVISTMHE